MVELNPAFQEEYDRSKTLQSIVDEFKRLKGQFVLRDNKVGRLIGIGTDDQDYYYVLYDGRVLRWCTCVGRITQLKDKINDVDYNEMKRLAVLNHYDQLAIKLDKEEHTSIMKKWIADIQKPPAQFIIGPFFDLV